MVCKVVMDDNGDYRVQIDMDSVMHVPQFRQIIKGPYGLNGFYYLCLFCSTNPFGRLVVEDREKTISDIIRRKPIDKDKKVNFDRYYRSHEFEAAEKIFYELYTSVDELSLRNKVNQVADLERAVHEYAEDIKKELEYLKEKRKKINDPVEIEELQEEINMKTDSWMNVITESAAKIEKVRKVIREIEKEVTANMPQSKTLGFGFMREQILNEMKKGGS